MMRIAVRFALLLILLLALVRGAGAQSQTGEVEGTIEVAGAQRTYRAYVPASYDGELAVPLVLALHGGGSTGRGMSRLAKLNGLAERHVFIVVYPDALNRRWQDGRQSGVADRRSVDDVNFLAALIDKLSREYHIDAKRVYSTGISNGGFMSHRLACDLSGKIAAIAVVAATMGRELSGKCNPGQPVSVLLMHGTEDPLVPYEGGRVQVRGGGTIISAPDAVKNWVELNGCAARPKSEVLPDVADDGTRTRRETYAGCKNGTEVVFLIIEGGGHTWPSGPQYLPVRRIGRVSRDFDASTTIWEFLAAHPRR